MKKRISTGLAIGFFLLGAVGISQATSLIITGVIDGPLSGGTPKAVELYALQAISDLSIYSLGFANNGGGSDGEEFTFPTIAIAQGDFFYVASESAGFNNFFNFAPEHTSSAAGINGDDAIELFRSGSVVDVFGEIAVDGTGQPWEYLDGWSYRNDGTGGEDSSTFLLSEWHFSSINALDGETRNSTAVYPFPAETFSPLSTPQSTPIPEPGTILLLGTGLAGLIARRRRMPNA